MFITCFRDLILIKTSICVLCPVKLNGADIIYVCLFHLAPKIEKINDHICEITWEYLQPMKGDPVIYNLQVMVGKDSEFKQVCIKIPFYMYIIFSL